MKSKLTKKEIERLKKLKERLVKENEIIRKDGRI